MPESRKALRELKDDKAQGMIDWLHVILLRPALPGIWLRKKSTRVMYQLCKASDLYPHCHILTNVTIGPYRGCGGFSDIYEGNQGGRILCLKMLRLHPGTDIGTVQTACAREVTTWAQMRHPNIWPFHGLYFYLNGNSRRLCLVSPWARNGDLPAYLRANPNAPRETLIHDVALGLQYLEQKGLVHGDLKGLNILVSDSGTACITDFGVSSFRNDGTVSMTIGASTQGGGGSSRWAAPESVMGHPPSFKSDIWAFGCVCFEVLTGLLPFYECPNDLPIVIKLFSGELPSGSNTLQDLHPDMRELLNQCWNKEPAARPSCREILRMLKPMGATGVDRHDMGGDNRCLQAVGDVTIDRTKIREILDSVGSAEPC
ncbi:kinase-like protein [Macrolepiota fuliginosa MF-IS2]|uniref:Kinase-like protein n=1 Tax=Macrolepiota fuliginosa MF-IS2 TaxID=1400762 RepID=A0A9P6BXW0_9AGAR|nr:kinase-like protein [Macrolepiota fuliginosa MF-IS2]